VLCAHSRSFGQLSPWMQPAPAQRSDTLGRTAGTRPAHCADCRHHSRRWSSPQPPGRVLRMGCSTLPLAAALRSSATSAPSFHLAPMHQTIDRLSHRPALANTAAPQKGSWKKPATGNTPTHTSPRNHTMGKTDEEKLAKHPTVVTLSVHSPTRCPQDSQLRQPRHPW
jgi:hypothetical protein